MNDRETGRFKGMIDLNYRVCLMLPDQNPHAACFREIALLLISALKSHGLHCDFSTNALAPDRTNILLGYHLLTFEEGLKNFRYIPYQLEQLNSKEFPFSSNMEAILRHATMVWDYSEKNIDFLNSLGIQAKLLVPGYHENLETIPDIPDSDRPIDILFYGSIGERRKKILDELANICNVKVLFGVYGEKRDEWIRRSKIILNINHYSQHIFEAVRVSYLLNNRCLVVSEAPEEYCYPFVSIPIVSYEHLTDTCRILLKYPEELDMHRRTTHFEFKTYYPMSELIEKVLND
ncbi:MAG: hypothetical protein ACM3SY_19970 [Candidatus Omnitrophota bacterium]